MPWNFLLNPPGPYIDDEKLFLYFGQQIENET
jgi:hypothetical protein